MISKEVEQSKLDIIEVKSSDFIELSLNGSLDAFTAMTLEDRLGSLFTSGNLNILINFAELQYISSAGLGVFMSYIEEIRDKNGDIKMYGMSPKIFKIFDLLGFPMIFDIKDDRDSALLAFKG